MKQCKDCLQLLPVGMFRTCKNNKDKLTGKCKSCLSKYRREYYTMNKDHEDTRNKKWYSKNREYVSNWGRNHRLTKTYNITFEQKELLISNQNNRCSICEREFNSEIRPVVDHCHKTGVIRGILCDSCNVSIGRLEENTGTLLKAIQYLKGFSNTIPSEFLDVMEVLEFGATKYGKDSWLHGIHFNHKDNCGSIFRHVSEVYTHKVEDDESKLHPALHAAARLLMHYTLYKRDENLKNAFLDAKSFLDSLDES